MKTKIIRSLFWIVTIAILAGLMGGLFKTIPKNNTGMEVANFGGTFTLTNHLGQKVTDKDYQNQYRLLYFGFTYCPAICPTELQRIATVLKELGAEEEKVQPIFITVDPERDDVNAMKTYVEMFHPRLIGLTGTQEQTDIIKKAYKVYSAKVQDEEMNDYTVDHSSYIYFMGPKDRLIRIFKGTDSIEKMTTEIKKSLKNSNPQ